MSMDLLDRLFSDIITVTEQLMKADPVDLAVFVFGVIYIEKSFMSMGDRLPVSPCAK